MSKEERLVLVAETALKLILLHGFEGLSHSRLARAAGISRPWLYKYMGAGKEDIVAFAVDHFGRLLADLDQPSQTTRDGWLRSTVEGTERVLQVSENWPWVIQIYHRYIGTTNVLGERIQYIREQHMQKSTKEISQVLECGEDRARAWSECIVGFQLTAALHWVLLPPPNKVHFRNELLATTRLWLEALPHG